MKAAVRASLDAALRRSPMQLYFRQRASNRLAVLAYHGVDDPESFARQIAYLVRVARPVSLGEVIDAVSGRQELPPRSVLVTFDDGHRSVLDIGLPVLAREGVPAVAFVLPGLLDTDLPFWWAEVDHLVRHGGQAGPAPDHVQLGPPTAWVRWLKTTDDTTRREVLDELRATAREPTRPQAQLRRDELVIMEDSGIEVGNHTMSHPCLDRCDDATVEAEVGDAHASLEASLGHSPRAFAYPNGNWDIRAERALTDRGYAVGFLFDHQLSDVTRTSALRASRLRVSTETRLDRFATILSGFHAAVHNARGLG